MTNEEEYLVYANSQLGEIRGMNIEVNDTQRDIFEPISSLDKPVAVDVLHDQIFYSDSKGKRIASRHRKRGLKETFIEEGGAVIHRL